MRGKLRPPDDILEVRGGGKTQGPRGHFGGGQNAFGYLRQ